VTGSSRERSAAQAPRLCPCRRSTRRTRSPHTEPTAMTSQHGSARVLQHLQPAYTARPPAVPGRALAATASAIITCPNHPSAHAERDFMASVLAVICHEASALEALCSRRRASRRRTTADVSAVHRREAEVDGLSAYPGRSPDGRASTSAGTTVQTRYISAGQSGVERRRRDLNPRSVARRSLSRRRRASAVLTWRLPAYPRSTAERQSPKRVHCDHWPASALGATRAGRR